MTPPHPLRRLRKALPGPLLMLRLRRVLPLTALILTLGCSLSCSSGGTKLYGRDLTNFPGGQVTFISRSASITLVGDRRLKTMGVPGDSPGERYQNFYSTPRDSSNAIKVVDDQAIAGLLEAYEDLDLKKASALRDPAGLDAGSALAVMEGSTSYVLVRPTGPGADLEVAENFDIFTRGLYDLFNSVEGFQSLGNRSIDFRSRHDKAVSK